MPCTPNTPPPGSPDELHSINRFGRTTSIWDVGKGTIRFLNYPMSDEERAYIAAQRAERVAFLRENLAQQAVDFHEVARLALIAAEAAEAVSGALSLDTLDQLGFRNSYAPDGRNDPFTSYEFEWESDPGGWEARGPLAGAMLEVLRDQTLAILARELTDTTGPLAEIAAKAQAETGERPSTDEEDDE